MRLIPILIIVGVFIAPVHAEETQKPERPKLAVMPLQPLGGVKKDVAKILTGMITNQAGATRMFREVISADEVSAVLKAEQMKDALGCDDVSCAAEISGALGADQMITGSVGKLGSKITIQLTLFDNKKMAVVKRAQESVKNDEDLYEAAVNSALSTLFGRAVGGAQPGAAVGTTDIGERPTDWAPEAKGEQVIVSFSSDPAGAVVSVDGNLLCQDTSKGCSKMLAAGGHRVSMQMENYLDRTEFVAVEKGTKIAWKLAPNFGWLTVRSTPAGLDVSVNGKVTGKTPIEKATLAPGAYEVLVQDPCYFASGKKIQLKRESEEVLEVQLSPREGAIQVTAQDEKGNDIEADVLVDGTKIGTAPGAFKVSVCAKEVEVKSAKIGSWKEKLTGKLQVIEKQSTRISAVLMKSEWTTSRFLSKAPTECRSGDQNACARACDNNHKASCKLLADGFGRANQLFQNACNGGAGGSCTNLGILYQNGLGVPKDDARAVSFYRKACEDGDALGCNNLGWMYDQARGVTQDAGRAVELYRKACDDGHFMGCGNLAEAYLEGRGVTQDAGRGLELYRKACDDGYAGACNQVGITYEERSGLARDDRQAVEMYRKACDGGEATGCSNLGAMYMNGAGVAQDDKRAVEMYQKACDGGSAAGCGRLGWMYSEGRGVTRDDGRAVEFLRVACDDGHASACSNLGWMYAEGRGVKRDKNRAAELYRKACGLGLKKECAAK